MATQQSGPAMTAAQKSAAQAQQMAAIRAAVLGSPMVTQPVGSPTVLTTPSLSVPNIISFQPRSVGLLNKFLVKVAVNFTAGGAMTRAPFGPACVMSNITLTDLNNTQRINTTGWHLALVQSARKRHALGAAVMTDSPLGFGNNNAGTISAPASVAAGATGTLYMIYELPVMYQDNDLRGAIYLGTTQAQMSVALSLNQLFCATAGVDPVQSCYSTTGAAPVINSVTVQPYQVYLDQLPQTSGGVLLPTFDMQTVYQLANTNNVGFVANSPLSLPYTNLRQYLSTILIYDNGGTLNPGTDITFFQLQQANSYQFWQKDPALLAYQTRNHLGDDMPTGTYLFDTRQKPVDTSAFGNMALIMQPNSVAPSAQVLLGYEFFATALTITNAQVLPSN